tara:strand:+ start:1231 stop:1566 length:336 start_codon:yes stop_codon:yes gene_type:complete
VNRQSDVNHTLADPSASGILFLLTVMVLKRCIALDFGRSGRSSALKAFCRIYLHAGLGLVYDFWLRPKFVSCAVYVGYSAGTYTAVYVTYAPFFDALAEDIDHKGHRTTTK